MSAIGHKNATLWVMWRSYVMIFMAVVVVALLSGGILWWLNTASPGETAAKDVDMGSGTKERLAAVEIPVLSRSLKRLSSPEDHYSVSAEYPSIRLVGRPTVAEEVNDVIVLFVDNMVNDFVERARNSPEREAGSDATESDLTMRSSALLLSPTIVALRFDAAEYIAGAAHPNMMTSILNYDVETHAILTTTDLFASSTLALPFLSQAARNVLQQRFTGISNETWEQEVIPGTAPTRENFRAVGLTTEGLIVIFDPYQVAPYARGTQEVRIPHIELFGLLSPDAETAIRLAKENITEAVPE